MVTAMSKVYGKTSTYSINHNYHPISNVIMINYAAYFVDGFDIGKFTMKIVDDHRTVNKNIHFRPPINCYSMNELASLWESKIARKIPRLFVSENDLLAIAAGSILLSS